MRGLHKAGNPREIRSLRQAGSSRAYVKQDLCRRGCALKNEGPYIKQKMPERKEVFEKQGVPGIYANRGDRKSTRLNSSHVRISYPVFRLIKKTTASII